MEDGSKKRKFPISIRLTEQAEQMVESDMAIYPKLLDKEVKRNWLINAYIYMAHGKTTEHLDDDMGRKK